MLPMGVITCTVPMNPSGDVIYTHKKFKRATSEASDNAEKQPHGERGGPELALAGPRPTYNTSQSSPASSRPTTTPPHPVATLVNGHVTSHTIGSVIGSVSSSLSVEIDDNKRRVSNNSGGKYKCEYCGVGCAKPSVLDKHKRTHTNERPYSCEQCSLAFKTKSNYKKHTRSRTHVRKCDGVAHDNSDGTVEPSDNVDGDTEDGPKSSLREGRVQQLQPADFSLSKISVRDQPSDLPSTSVSTQQDELGASDRGKSLYKPKFHISAQYAHREENGRKGQTPPPSRQQPTPPQDALQQLDHTAINPSTYQPHNSSNHSQSSQGLHSNHSRHSPSPANLAKQGLPPLDIWAANKKEENVLTGQRNSVATPQSANSLWKGIKSPSPELVGQHITKLIVENQAIVETHNPLWSRRYRRQPSIGSSSSESDGSGTSKGRRSSLADLTLKNTKVSAVGTAALPAGLGPIQQQYSRERSNSLTVEAMMVEPRSSYSPSLPPTPHLSHAQPPVTPISASKPSISSQGHTTSYSQSAPAFTTSIMGMTDLTTLEGPRKRSSSEGPSIVRDLHKTRVIQLDDPALLRQHPQNPEGSVIKNLLLHSRAAIAGTIDQNLERLECERLNQPAEVGHYSCSRCGVPCRSPENLDVHQRHYCGQRLGGTGSERGTPDSVKSGDGGRWPSEQDVALDLQKKPERTDHFERERSLSRGSSVGEASQRRGSEEENRYRVELSPRIFRSESVPDGASPPTKKRKMSEIDSASQDRSVFLSPIFSPRGQGAGKGETAVKMLDDMNKQKTNNLQLFGGEVQICDGNELKTMRIDPSQPPSPAIDICIPPQQLGGSIPKAEVSLPTSVVVTIAKSGLNSGGTMVQVESQISTSTKTVPSLVSSSLSREQPSTPVHTSNSKASLANIVYNNDASKFAFSSFLPYAPLLQLPNLAIPGIPTPDLGSLSLPTYPTSVPAQSFPPVKNPQQHGMTGKLKANIIHSPAAPSPSKMSPTGHPHPSVHGNQPIHFIREKEKEQPKGGNKLPAAYPALIPIGDEKVPYVPGIPGPYSQAGMVVQPPLHRIHKSPNVLAPPSSSFNSISTVPMNSMPQAAGLMSPSREKSLLVPRPKEGKDSVCSPVRENLQPFHVSKIPSRQSPQLPPQEIQISRVKTPVNTGFKASERNVTPDVRVHPPTSEINAFDKKTAEKSSVCLDDLRNDTAVRDEAKEGEEFLPPRKRPNSLALKPQPYVPKSSLALIGTTLVSPDTPRPKKSCVQMFLNGSAYTYLGHKVSTKSYFCCISKQQPMYVPQSTDPKLSMYSNWQIRKPAEDNPLSLTPYQHMSLYMSRKVDQMYTIAKPKELNLIQTHSSYWTFKEEKEKNKGKDDKHKEKDSKTVKNEDPVARTSDSCSSEDSRPVIKREPDDESSEPSSKSSEDAEGSDSSSAKRIKIFEGGFKSTEDYTYVRGRGRGRYVCGACGIRCKKPSMLKKHIRTHTDLRPYACSHCTFSFKTKGNLTKHLRSKAHYKRCVEMGVVPVPTVVDESHVNEEALALQGKMEQEQERMGNLEAGEDDDDDDEDDDEDEEDDGDEEDDEDDDALENDQFEDADKMHVDESFNKNEVEMKSELQEIKENVSVVTSSTSRTGVLVMAASTCKSSVSPAFAHTSKDPKAQKVDEGVEVARDSPMDLSVKKTLVQNLSPSQDKSMAMKKPPVPRRPSFLPLMGKSSVSDLRSPVANLTSPGTPTTPIREHPSEILSPVTESSSLLKSIYNTTSRASHASNREKLEMVIDPAKENGCNKTVVQAYKAYIKERAVLDTTIKRQQYKDSSSDTSPDSPHNNLPNMTPATSAGTEKANSQSQKSEMTQNNRVTTVEEIKREGRAETESAGPNCETTSASVPSPCSPAINNAAQAATSRMPTPPANLTVMNSGGIDTKTAFLVPSGVVPSSLNRLGNDDGKCRCNVCHKEFNRPSQLTLHMNIHYMERPYRCDSCGISFRTNGHLQKHKRSVSHFNKVNMNMTFGTPSTDNPRPFKCHDCKIAFRIHGHLAKHLRSKMHIMKLECLGKLPFGTYAEIERSGANLNEIDTTDCDNSLESLQVMASRLYEKDPSKLAAWQNQQQHRVRTVSNSSTNSDDYPLQDDQDDSLAGCGNDEDTEGDEDEEITAPQEASRHGVPGSSVGPVPSELHSPHAHGLPPIEIGSGATAGLLACHICHEKFLDLEHLSDHLYNVHKVSVTYRNS